MFAPAVGVGVDIVNTNSTGCLAAHLHPAFGRDKIQVQQGHIAGHPSPVLAAAATAKGISTRVGGTAVIRTMPQNPAN